VKKFLGTILTLSLLLVASSALATRAAAADEAKPIVAISFAGYDEVRANLAAIGKLGGKTDLAEFLEGILVQATQGKGLDCLDKKAPWGALVEMGEMGQPVFYGFVPVTDLKTMMEILKKSPLGIQYEEKDGVYEIEGPGGQLLFLSQQDKFTAVVADKGLLDQFPTDPQKYLGDMPKKYLLALTFLPKNIPEQYLGFINMMTQMGVPPQEEDETDEQYARRQASQTRSMEKISMLVKETERIVLGANIDRETSKITFDVEIIADAGSKWAEELTKAKPGKSKFAAFDLPEAAIFGHSLNTMTDQDVSDAKEDIRVLADKALRYMEKQELTEEQMKLVKEVIDDALAVTDKNLEMKKSEMGYALCLDPSAVTLVAGGAVAEGKPVENLLKKVFDAVKEEEPDLGKGFKFNADTYKGFRLHTAVVPVTEELEQLKPFVGEELTVVVGVGEKQVFVAAGADAVEILKKAIDKSQTASEKEVLPAQMILSYVKIGKFVAGVIPDEDAKTKIEQFVQMLEQSGGKDHLIINAQAVENGLKIHLELEEGFMKVLGSLSQMLGMPGVQ
jgi:hypothetical protein